METTYDFMTFDAEELTRVLRATIHKTGKLGFSTDAINGLALKPGMGVRIHKNNADQHLYMELLDDADSDKKAWRIIKAGDYYYLNTRALFDRIKEDYAAKSIYFDLVPVDMKDRRLYRMNRHETKGRGRDEIEMNGQA